MTINKGFEMNYPDEFKKLAFDVLIAHILEIHSEEGIRNHILESLKPQQRQRLELYLTEILDGRMSDEEINALWDKTGTDVMFYRPAAARNFLLKVKGWLAESNGTA